MLKKTIEYVDYDGETRKEDFYFNLSKAELLEMDLSENGGVDKLLRRIVAEKDTKQMIEWFKLIIMKSYGVKTNDGKRFIKNQNVLDEFMQTEAYSNLFFELATDDGAAAKFMNGILPNGHEVAANQTSLPKV